ncbi:uncharacterized protein LOC117611888 [Osmia lignaria lignaria]|uniref:uncharacterized protein LOC117611888 n=1 Tax=Osmia lignaria lignaria TaxID=1437193 RepID=UPI00402B426C
MKMTDSNEKDDCMIEAVTPIRTKKMKQAQLPFQIRSPTQSPNVMKTKKRKLSSPSVGCKSPKAVKVSKPASNKDDAKVETLRMDSNDIEIVESIEIESVKENTSNKVNAVQKSTTPKQLSTKQKKIEKQDKSKSNCLTKFLKKTDTKEDDANDDQENPLLEEKDESVNESFDTETDANVSQKAEELVGAVNDSCDVNSDVVNLSSDSNDRGGDHLKSNTEQSMNSDSSKTPKIDKIKKTKLTPTQQEKKLLSIKKKEEMQKRRREREIKLEEDRNNRRKEKEMKRKKREDKIKAEKEQKLFERKMRKQKKEQEIEQKLKEKQAREEDRKKKEEEKRKKEEEKLEAERKKQKAASNFTSFFVTKKLEKSFQEESTLEVKNFMPFEVKADMKMAPISRRTLNKKEKLLLDEKCNEGNMQISDLYLSEIKDKKIISRKSTKTWPLEAKEDAVTILDDENDGTSNIVNQNIVFEKHRAKLLQFSENQRPPYWGTWRKRSRNIKSRKPFSRDTKWFNYEVDSDEEWEEEEPGESLHGSEEEKDEENPEDNEYDVDNEFMVPHGYLSNEEVRADEEDEEDMNPQTQKFKLKVLGQQFESERSRKTSKLKPKIIGCIWRGPNNEFPPNVPERTREFLTAHEAWVRQIPVALPVIIENETMNPTECGTPSQQSALSSSKKSQVPEAVLPDLIRLLHGNVHGKKFLVKEFLAYLNKEGESEYQMSKARLMKKICEIGKWMMCSEEGPMHLKACWYVSEEVRKEYMKEDLPLPNQWSYTLTPKRRSIFNEATEKLEKEDKDKEKKNVSLITQFTKKISQEEMKKHLNASPIETTAQNSTASSSLSVKPVGGKAPKRATFITLSKEGEPVSNVSKESLSRTVNTETKKRKSDEVIILDSSEDDNVKVEKKKKK